MGWSSQPVTVSFVRPPKARVLDGSGHPLSHPPVIRWTDLHVRLAYPVTAEVYVDQLLDRREFRALCDAHVTREAILGKLASTQVTTPGP